MAIKWRYKVAIKNKQFEKILDYAMLYKEFRTSDIEILLMVKKSRARLLVGELVKIGSLESLGNNKDRRYRIKKA